MKGNTIKPREQNSTLHRPWKTKSNYRKLLIYGLLSYTVNSATRGSQEEWMEGNLKGDYLRSMPKLCLEDRMNWYASSIWQRVIWLVLGDRLWSTNLLSSDWERRPCPSKYFDLVSMCMCGFPPVISSIFDEFFPFPFPYFVLFVLRYFSFHMVNY